MLERQEWKGKSVLLLQGPVGPYFKKLAGRLREAGATVYKLNFNGGDRFFFPDGEDYVGPPEGVAARVTEMIRSRGISAIALFGEYRPIHREIGAACKATGTTLYVFEEGYFRPAYITCETWGVNANSRLPRKAADYAEELPPVREAPPSPNAYFWWVIWAILYWTASWFSHRYPGYQHHRRAHLWLEAGAWIRGAARKYWYQWKERGVQERLTGPDAGRFFLVPLQVHNDTQITHHSEYPDVIDFIEDIMESFAANAPRNTLLVFKHHPMDRAYRDYTALIRSLSALYGLKDRVFYIHDQHLPTLLDAAIGVVVVNSTTGISAIHQGVPTKVTGRAFYDIEGLTSQRPLADFWKNAKDDAPDMSLYERFRRIVIRDTQINDNFNAAMDRSKAVVNAGKARQPAHAGHESATIRS